MRTVQMTEIEKLYKKCGVDNSSASHARLHINTGTLDNKLNTGSLFGEAKNRVRWTNSATKYGK